MAPVAIGPSVWPMPNAIVIAAIAAGHAAGRELKRTTAVVDPTTAKNETPNASADAASHAEECPSSGSAAPMVLTPRMIAVLVPPLSRASTRRHSHGVTKALKPIRHQNALCAAAPPPASRIYAIMNVI